jgi:hypothetical protein
MYGQAAEVVERESAADCRIARTSSSGADVLWPPPSLGDWIGGGHTESGSVPDLPDTPFGGDPARIAEAYRRCGLPRWGDANSGGRDGNPG